jgi:SAM-dependent methyltransferase
LGDTGAIVRAIRRDSLPVRRVLDVGCATGMVLAEIGERLNVEVIGVDLDPRPSISSVPVVRADAIRERLPDADVAFSMHMAHHLPEEELAQLIRNVGRSARRFILLDLVRHPVPLALFRLFVAPLMGYIAAEDGRRSVRRAFTTAELKQVTERALAGSGSVFRHSVTPFYIRQMIDIRYGSKSDFDDVDLGDAGAVAGEGDFRLLERP